MIRPDFASLSADLVEKAMRLEQLLTEMESVIIAFSGGVDSSLLAYAANMALGDRAIAVTIRSELDTSAAAEKAVEFAAHHHIHHEMIKISALADQKIASNPPDRCYHCKRKILLLLQQKAQEEGIRYVIEGQNLDDLGDYRPGRIAVSETGTRSPFIEAGLTKTEIRLLSHAFGLETWDEPSSPCLATRIPYGTQLQPKDLTQIGLAEEFLHALGFHDCRVRLYGEAACIEVSPDQLHLAFNAREKITQRFSDIGFYHTTLDLTGYTRGSLNKKILDAS